MLPALKIILTRRRREPPRHHAAPGSGIHQQIVAFSCTSGSPLATIKGGSQGRFQGGRKKRERQQDEHIDRTRHFYAA